MKKLNKLTTEQPPFIGAPKKKYSITVGKAIAYSCLFGYLADITHIAFGWPINASIIFFLGYGWFLVNKKGEKIF